MRGRTTWLERLTLLGLLGVGLWLRWRYIQEISLFVDEFNTAWAAKNILLRGLPIFPSGNFYAHGMLFTYLETPFVVGSFDEIWVRLPGLALGLLAIPASYRVGRAMLSPTAGLVAAAAVALDPEAIVWGGRARMYGLLQLLVLLAVYLWFVGLAKDSTRHRVWAMLTLVAALLCHVEAILLLPACCLGILAVWPPRNAKLLWAKLMRPNVVFPLALALLGAAAVVLLTTLGQPGQMEALQEVRPLVQVNAALGGPKAFAPAFLASYRLPFALLALAGLLLAIRPYVRRGEAPGGTHTARLYLQIVLLCFLVLLFFLAGATWQRDRYVFMVLPILWLLAGDAVGRLLGRLPSQARRPWAPAAIAVVAALWVGLTGSRQAYVQDWGYDLAFRSVQSQAQPDDVVLTPFPAASMLYLGRCDFFATQRQYEEFVMPKDGQIVDRWAGAPLLNSTSGLKGLLKSGRPVWLVVDGWRFQSWFENDFIRTVLDQMTPAFAERGMAVFRGQGYAERPAPALSRPVSAGFGDELSLERVEVSAGDLTAGEPLEVSLAWHRLAAPRPAYTVFLHLVGRDGERVAQEDELLLGGYYQPTVWPQGEAVLDRHTLDIPADLPAGRYRLEMGLYRPDSLETLPLAGGGADRVVLGYLGTSGQPEPAPQVPLEADFGGQIRLLGYSLACEPPYAPCSVRLYWQGIAGPDADYTVFVHMVAPDGHAVAQHDGMPEGGFYPTSAWRLGETIEDEHPVAVTSGVPAGDYPLVVGLYRLDTGTRLQAVDAAGRELGDSVTLTLIHVPGP